MSENNFAGWNSGFVVSDTSAVGTEMISKWHWKQGGGKETGCPALWAPSAGRTHIHFCNADKSTTKERKRGVKRHSI